MIRGHLSALLMGLASELGCGSSGWGCRCGAASPVDSAAATSRSFLACILDSEPAARAYAIHFETQLRRGRIRRLLSACYRHFSRAGAIAAGLDLGDNR